jgi:glycosyltransferase involved in cell wall biosynthesis
MRVDLVLGTATGGVGVHVHYVAAGLVEAGWAVRVVGPAATEELFGFTRVGATFVPIEIRGATPSPSLLRSIKALRAEALGADVVHAHGLRAALVAVLCGRGPVIATWHNLVLDPAKTDAADSDRGGHGRGPAAAIVAAGRRLVLGVGERIVARRSTVGLGASPDLVARIRRLGGRDARLAPVAAPVRRPMRGSQSVREELGLRPGDFLIVAVSRLHPQKGLDILIDAAARWRDRTPRIHVVIAGDGPAESELAAQIARTGAPVNLLGRRGDAIDLLAAADIVVLPSRWEARSLVAQEAMRAGRPLVVTAVGGLPELVGNAAIQIPPEDVDALDASVIELLGDPAERAALGARASQHARLWPTQQDTVAQLERIYRELTGRRR